MSNRNIPFHLMFAPDCQLEAVAPDVQTAIALARDALPFLQAASTSDSPRVSSSEDDDEYVLTCLLCGVVNPLRVRRTALVAMQEHQIEEHDLLAEAFSSAVRILLVTASVETYVWAFPPVVISLLDLPQASYMRATKRRTKQAAEPPDSEVIRLVFKSQGLPPVLQTIHLVRQDEHAWYGYPTDAPRSGNLLVWPKGEWEYADPTGTLE